MFQNLKKIQDRNYIDNLFVSVLPKLNEIPISVYQGDQVFQFKMLVTRDGIKEYKINLLKNGISLNNFEEMEIAFFYKEIYFIFITKLINEEAELYDIMCPTFIYNSNKRLVDRYKLEKTEESYVVLDKNEKMLRLVDISTRGASFLSEDKFIEEKQNLRNFKIEIEKEEYIIQEACVRHIKKNSKGIYVYGFEFTELEWNQYNRLFAYIFNKTYKNLRTLNEFASDEVARLYSEVRYASIKPSNASEKVYIDLLKDIEKIQGGNKLLTNLVYYKNKKPFCLGSVFRIYNNTFFAQQISTNQNNNFCRKERKEVELGQCDIMLNRRDFKIYMSYITKEFSSYNDMYNKFQKVIDDKENFIYENLTMYQFVIDEIDVSIDNGYNIEVLTTNSEFLNFLDRKISSLEKRCYDYNKVQLGLNGINRAYKEVGLLAKRKIFTIEKDEQILAYAVADSFSDGIFVEELADMCKIYFLNDDVDKSEIIKKLAVELGIFYKENNKNTFNIIYRNVFKDVSKINVRGVNKKHTIGMVIMDTEGLMQYKKLLISNYEAGVYVYPLTHLQKEVWNNEITYPARNIELNACTVPLGNQFDFDIIEKSINLYIQKNHSIRLRIIVQGNEPKQYIKKYEYRKIDMLYSSDKAMDRLDSWEKKITKEPFNVIDDDLYYFSVIMMDKNKYSLYIKFHKLVADEWTLEDAAQRIIEYCNKLKNGGKITGDNRPSYVDYIYKEEDYKESEQFVSDRTFWDKRFKLLYKNIGLKKIKRDGFNTKYDKLTFKLNQEMYIKINSYCKKNKIAKHSFFLGLISAYINETIPNKDIILGTIFSNRISGREKNMAGMFDKVLPMRLKPQKKDSFKEYIFEVSKEYKEYIEHQRYPNEYIFNQARKGEKIDKFDILLSYRELKEDKNFKVANNGIKRHYSFNQTYPLFVSITDEGRDDRPLELNMMYKIKNYNKSEIHKLYEGITDLLEKNI